MRCTLELLKVVSVDFSKVCPETEMHPRDRPLLTPVLKELIIAHGHEEFRNPPRFDQAMTNGCAFPTGQVVEGRCVSEATLTEGMQDVELPAYARPAPYQRITE